MSVTPTTRRITREELQGDADQKIEGLLRPLNLFFEDVTSALDRDLTVEENMDADILNVRVQTGAAYPADWEIHRFRHNVKRRVSGQILINIVDNNNFDAVFTDPVQANVRFNDTQGEILHLTGLAPSGDYTITLLII